MEHIELKHGFFFYRSKIPKRESAGIANYLVTAVESLRSGGVPATLNSSLRGDQVQFDFRFGTPTEADLDKAIRLSRTRPRRRLKKGSFPAFAGLAGASDAFPADVYIGSGVSYEARLPTLCDMHECFGVDSEKSVGFASGKDDPLPKMLAEEGVGRLKKFCGLHVKALSAPPTFAMGKLAELQRKGIVGSIFTDNVDNMLSKVGASFERVRGTGVFNERHKVTFKNKTLIVIGVAADRREIIQQARARRSRVVIVNPIAKVSPNVTHLEYVRSEDH